MYGFSNWEKSFLCLKLHAFDYLRVFRGLMHLYKSVYKSEGLCLLNSAF